MDKMENKPWWNNINLELAASRRPTITQIASSALLSLALKNDGCVYQYNKDGNLLITRQELFDKLNKLGGKIISRTFGGMGDDRMYSNSPGSGEEYVFSWDNTVLTLSIERNNWTYINASSMSEKFINTIKEIGEESITQTTKGKAYVFVNTDSGPDLRQLSGKAGVDLERGNYTSQVLEDFDHIVKDLRSNNPCGRLIIADGVPGTGKTFLVRGITNAVDKATFILVPPSMISDMMSPQFIPVLMDHHIEKHPIVFIIEDADACLVERAGDNMNSISSLLNLGDGIFGSLFDVRIICTTNAKRMDIDPAIMRKGRCCRYIETTSLPKEQAEQVFQRLVNDTSKILPHNQKSYTIGDIYNFSRNDSVSDVGFVRKKEAGVGFGND